MKKMKQQVAGLLIVVLMLSLSFAGSAFAAGNEVKLIDSQIYIYKYGYIGISGNVEVENLGYAKEVTVHYTTDNTNWYDTSASYAGATDSTHEKWSFSISTSSLTTEHPELKNLSFIKFAIKYTVNGNTYWDNNGSANYYNEPHQYAQSAVILGKPNALAGYRAIDTGHFVGSLYVKNLSPTKTVKVVYTTDNWATTQEGYATYYGDANSQHTVELWNFSFSVPGATEVKYAIALTANGQTYWDNNYGNNYTVN